MGLHSGINYNFLETADGDEGPPPEAAPVEGVVITNYTDEEQMDLAEEAEQARLALASAISGSSDSSSSETDATILADLEALIANPVADDATSTGGCPSNRYIGQQQADGSWKTVCKE